MVYTDMSLGRRVWEKYLDCKFSVWGLTFASLGLGPFGTRFWQELGYIGRTVTGAAVKVPGFLWQLQKNKSQLT